MTSSWLTYWLRGGALLCGFVALGTAIAVLSCADESRLRQRWRRYLAELDTESRRLFLPYRGAWLAYAATSAGVLLLLAALTTRFYALAALTVLLPTLPRLWLSHQRRQRLQQLDAQVDGWLLTLANALRATASLGEAIESSVALSAPPLSQELDLMYKTYQLGTPLDAAIRQTSLRLGSRTLSSALMLLVIARDSGGNLPETLQTSAAALREMARLEGVVRTKTAEGKAQASVLGFMPVLLTIALHWMSPEIMRPLFQTPMGWVLLSIATALWVGAVLLARKILAVEV